MKATLTLLSTAALLYTAACQSVAPDEAPPGEDDDQPIADVGSDPDRPIADLPSDSDWRMALRDVTGSGFNPFEVDLGVDSVRGLEVKWIFDEATAGAPVQPIHATPVTSGSRIFVGSAGGVFYALDREGALLWQFTADNANPIMSILFSGGQSTSIPAPIVGAGAIPAGRPVVIFGDADGTIYSLRQETGELIWKVNVDAHPLGGVVGNSLLVYGSTVVIGLASIENAAFALPPGSHPCCTHRGGVVALDVDTGAELWHWDAVAESEVQPLSDAYRALGFEFGPSGGDVWGQPTYDARGNTVYFGTGQNFSPTAEGGGTCTTDAIVAVDATNGSVKWTQQFTADDLWVSGLPNPATGPSLVPPLGDGETRFVDQDVGDAPKIYRLENGQKVVGAGQKSGAYHVLDAATGEVVATTQLVDQANSLGGLQQGGAVAYGSVFEHGLHGAGAEGRVVARSLRGDGDVWSLEFGRSPMVGGLAVAGGVVFFQSPLSDGQNPGTWELYAVSAASGAILKQMTFPTMSVASPAVARGRLYVSFGNQALAEYPSVPAGGLIALGPP